MTPQQANESLKIIIQAHLTALQSGEFGTPTLDDLEFCGQLHDVLRYAPTTNPEPVSQ